MDHRCFSIHLVGLTYTKRLRNGVRHRSVSQSVCNRAPSIHCKVSSTSDIRLSLRQPGYELWMWLSMPMCRGEVSSRYWSLMHGDNWEYLTATPDRVLYKLLMHANTPAVSLLLEYSFSNSECGVIYFLREALVNGWFWVGALTTFCHFLSLPTLEGSPVGTRQDKSHMIIGSENHWSNSSNIISSAFTSCSST